jgi:hypothetical protein
LLTPAADDGLGRHEVPYKVLLMDRFTQNDPERQANIAFILIFLGIIAVGALTIWLFYGGSF